MIGRVSWIGKETHVVVQTTLLLNHTPPHIKPVKKCAGDSYRHLWEFEEYPNLNNKVDALRSPAALLRGVEAIAHRRSSFQLVRSEKPLAELVNRHCGWKGGYRYGIRSLRRGVSRESRWRGYSGRNVSDYGIGRGICCWTVRGRI